MKFVHWLPVAPNPETIFKHVEGQGLCFRVNVRLDPRTGALEDRWLQVLQYWEGRAASAPYGALYWFASLEPLRDIPKAHRSCIQTGLDHSSDSIVLDLRAEDVHLVVITRVREDASLEHSVSIVAC